MGSTGLSAARPFGGALLGRDAELERLRALLAGDGGTMVVAGPAGIGKTALLDEALAGVTARRVLIARAVPSESKLPFGVLGELLEPVLPELDALPPMERMALHEALGLGPSSGRLDRRMVSRAFVGLAARLAPVVVAIDDAHWADRPSFEAVELLAANAQRLRVGVLIARAARGDDPAANLSGVGRRDHRPVLPTLALRALSRADARALARRCGAVAGVADRLVGALGGNPRALVDGSSALTAGQRRGAESMPAVPFPGARLTCVYAERLARLPTRTRAALLRAAAAGPATALAGEGADVLAPAEAEGLVTRAGGVARFARPEVRVAVYHAATTTERRVAHQALAAVLPEPERTRHRATAATGPDEDISAALERAAHEAVARGEPGSAMLTLRRAAELTPDPERARTRALAAGHQALLVAQPQTALSLATQFPPHGDPGARADARLLIGAASAHAGRPAEALALLEAEADRIVGASPRAAAMLLSQAAVGAMGRAPLERLLRMAGRARVLMPAGSDLIPATLEAVARVLLGDRPAARALLLSRAPELAASEPSALSSPVVAAAAMSLDLLEEQDAATRLIGATVRRARERGASESLALALTARSAMQWRRGDLAAARATAQEALDIGEHAVTDLTLSEVLNMLALIAAHLADDELCLLSAGRALAISRRLGNVAGSMAAERSLGRLALFQGHMELAIGHLERAREHQRRLGVRDPGFACVEGDLTEAYVRAGRLGDAAGSLGQLRAGALLTGGAWAAAAAARYAAMLGPDEDIDGHLAAAMSALERGEFGFEAARTRLVFGERLRRARRRVEARGLLAEAEADFRARGAARCADLAASELAAAGGQPGTRARAAERHEGRFSPSLAVDGRLLTAREREVASLVVAGATNLEVASALFVSRRTVEHHLRQIYRKLDIRSRSELAARFSQARPRGQGIVKSRLSRTGADATYVSSPMRPRPSQRSDSH